VILSDGVDGIVMSLLIGILLTTPIGVLTGAFAGGELETVVSRLSTMIFFMIMVHYNYL